MLASAPRSLQHLTSFDVPPNGPTIGIYARILQYRANPTAPIPNGRLRLRFTVAPRMRMRLHRAFALYAFLEIFSMCVVGTHILYREHDVIYADATCDCAGAHSNVARRSGRYAVNVHQI